jgi:glycosyltransferase involved in cell wall biosynthesis
MPLGILHVVGGTRAGSTRVVLNLLERHDRARFDPAVCFFSISPVDAEVRAAVTRLGVPWDQVVKASRYELGALDRLVDAFAALAPDLVVLHGFGAYSYGVIAARLAGVRGVVRVEHSPELYGPHYALVSALTASRTDGTILVSRHLERYLQERGTRLPRPAVVYNGIDPAPFEAIARPSLGGREPVLLMVARLDVAKDHATLVDALALLRDRGRQVRLRLAGDGPLRADIESRVRRHRLESQVELLGYRDDLVALHDQCDVVVLSTHFEGFGLALVEAMAAGRPVIATDVAAVPEVVADGRQGLLVPPRDPAALAAAIARLLDDPEEARAMGQRGRARVRERFTLDASVRAFDAALEDTALALGLLERNQPGGRLTRRAAV